LTASVTAPGGRLYETSTGIPAFRQSICASCSDSVSLFCVLLVDGRTTVEIGVDDGRADDIMARLVDWRELLGSSASPSYR